MAVIIEGIRTDRVGMECGFVLDCPEGKTVEYDGRTLTVHRDSDIWVKDPIGDVSGGVIELGPQGGIGRVASDKVGGVSDVIHWRIATDGAGA